LKRKTFDKLLTAAGGVMFVVLMVAGALLMVGSNFAASSVHNQLAEQHIYFPPASAFAHAKPGTEITPGMKPYLLRYAGKELLTGPEAKAYADHFIAVHLSELPDHGIYAELSAAARAHPTNKKLAALVTTSFEGTTLRGLLLEAYAFSVIGEIALWAGIAAFVLGGVMLVLVVLGFWHAGKVPPTAEV
jgi:hypothetical protein